MPTYLNQDGSPATGYNQLRLVTSDGTAVMACLKGGATPTLISTGALTLAGSSIPLKTEAEVLKMTLTPATANLLNIASGCSFDLQYNGTSRIKADSTGLGFFAATPAAKQTVTGSRGANAALASLCTALATLGLITDSTS